MNDIPGTSSVRRFIAGAVCPRCGAMDRLVTFTEEEQRYRECVACDFRDRMEEAGNESDQGELETRVSRRSDTRPPVEEQTIQFFPMKKKKPQA